MTTALRCLLTTALFGCGFQHGTAVDPDAAVEPITVAFDSAAQMIDEGAGTVLIPVSLSGVSTSAITVDYSAGAGTAERPGDFQLADGTLTFMPGQRDATISVVVASDAVEEPEETIVVDLAGASGATLGATTRHTLTISSDILPRVAFAVATPSVASEGTSPQVEVQLTVAPKQDVTVEVGVAGTASAADRALVDGSVLTFAAGVTSQQVPLGIVQDALDEVDETVVLTLENPSAQLMVAATGNTRAHTITDDDAPPQVAFAQATASAMEGNLPVNLSVQLSAVSGRAVTVPVSVDVASTASDPDDYALAATAVTIPAGATSANVVVNMKADNLDEDNETVIVRLGTPTNATLGAIASETLTITDNDAPPTVSFVGTSSSIDESTANFIVTVQLSTISGRTVIVPYTAAGTATSPDDYTIAPAMQVVVPAGQNSTTLTIAVKEDTDVEADETVLLTLGMPTNATLGIPAAYGLTIANDD